MSLIAGSRLGGYEILGPIGAGGMGEVYRARDTQLERDVAIKVLPRTLAGDPERLSRFDREAKILAALNHSNIAVIYGLVESEGGRALVMEVIEGETLASVIKRGPLSAKEACKIARQVAEALEAAHDRGIVHRDLKPGNIMVTPAGLVKVLDFGLAAMVQPERAAPGDPQNSPTLTIGGTISGTILGTASYMSPEQAEGLPVDKRADIWSFGVVLWEMLTGKRLFEAQSISRTLADVLRMEIDFSKLPPATPKPLVKLLERCLDREIKTRLRDIGEARIVLDGPMEAPSHEPVQAPPAPARRAWLPWSIAAFVLLALMPLNILHLRETVPPEHSLRYTIAAPENSSIHSFAVSPDGRFVAIAVAVNGKRQLWLRPLGALEATAMQTTEDARYPFWSPDSQYVGFFAQGKLRKVAAAGGPSQPVCDVTDGRGGSWNREDVIVYSESGSSDGVIRRVAAAGGVPSDVTKTRTRYLFPDFLPDGRHFVYEVAGISQEKNGLYLASLDGNSNRRILADASSVIFAPSAPKGPAGHLLFLRENNLMAQPFDGGSLQTSGDVFPVAEHIALANGNNYAPVTGSENGVLLYWSGGTGGSGGANQIVWYDRAGKLLDTVGSPGNILTPSISPDEKTIAFARQSAGAGFDIWLRDLARGTDRRFTSDPSSNTTPVWSLKGDHVVFRSDRGGHPGDLYQKATNGSGQEEPLLSTPNAKAPLQWSRDGRFFVYMESDSKTSNDLWVLPMGEAGDHKTMAFLHTEFAENHGQLSPDSRWMAYTSNVSGQREVYVRSFPAGENEQRISIAGGEQPRWRADGRELFYVAADGKMMAVAMKATTGPKPGFEAGTPAALFETRITGNNVNYFNYDVTADGKRFLVNTNGSSLANASTAAVPPLTVMVNWNAEGKK